MLLVALSCGGHWLSDRPQTIEIQWRVGSEQPAAVLQWQLAYEQTVVADGERRIPRGSSHITFVLSPVREIMMLSWHYRVVDVKQGVVLEAGEKAIRAYPPNLLADAAVSVKGKSVFVLGEDEGLSQLLTESGIVHKWIRHASRLAFIQPDIVLLTESVDDMVPRSRARLSRLNRLGACVIVLDRDDRSREYASGEGQDMYRQPIWREAHPLDVVLGNRQAAMSPDLPGGEMFMRCDAALATSNGGGRIRNEPMEAEALTVKKNGLGLVVVCSLPPGATFDDPRSHQGIAAALLRCVESSSSHRLSSGE
jgi:hypothetical protein